MILRRPIVLLVACALVGVVATACNAITDTGKYEVVDCPSGSCGDAGGAGTLDASATTDASAFDAGAVDTGPPPLPDCGSGRAPLRLIVTGSGGSVSSNPGSLSVAAGSTDTACFSLDTIELRTSGPTATWSGTTCKDGTRGDRCEMQVRAGGVTVTAALP